MREVANKMSCVDVAKLPPSVLCFCTGNGVELFAGHVWLFVELRLDLVPDRLEIIADLLLG